MGRLVTYLGNDPARLRCALQPGRAGLLDDGEACDGFGVGFYQGGEVLLQRRPRPPSKPIDLVEVVRDIRTDALVAHVRRGTHGAPKTENTHPFRFRSWLFAHHGSVAGFTDAAGEQMLGGVHDYLRRNVLGETDSEVLFHLFLERLHASGKMDDPQIPAATVGRALSETVALCEARFGRGASVLDMAVTNGRVAAVTRVGAPVSYYRVEGIRDCTVCRELPPELGRGPRPFDHDHLRAVVLCANGGDHAPAPDSAHAPASAAPLWREAPERSVLTVSHAIALEITPLDS